jgi:hypothetical protein
MRHSLSLAALLLTACHQEGADGYSFDHKEYDQHQVTVTIIQHPSLADLRRRAPEATEQVRDQLAAWSVLHGDRCEVHVVDPTVSWQPEWIGHEVAHCAWGRWHS